jgi:hypothetical protein
MSRDPSVQESILIFDEVFFRSLPTNLKWATIKFPHTYLQIIICIIVLQYGILNYKAKRKKDI